MIDNYTLPGLPGNWPVYIYTLSDDTGVRYVGQSVEPSIRFSTHKSHALSGRGKTPKDQWIRSVSGKISMTIVEKCDPESSNKRERHWANYLRQQGCDLVNGLFDKNARKVDPPTHIETKSNNLPKIVWKKFGFYKLSDGTILSNDEALGNRSHRHQPPGPGRPRRPAQE